MNVVIGISTRYIMRYILLMSILLCYVTPAFAAEPFVCAGVLDVASEPSHAAYGASKVVANRTTGIHRVIVIFAKFRGEHPGQVQAPAWTADIFNRDKPGSFAHFYETMSFGQLQVKGRVATRWYESAQEAVAYFSSTSGQGYFGQFNLEILRQADLDIDFSRFDNDGPDGLSNSGDDDGVVDVVVINTTSAPRNFLLGGATGIRNLGLKEAYVTNDMGIAGHPIRIRPRQGITQSGRDFAEVVGTMCHEYGHILGLPDLFNIRFREHVDGPEEDSAGIGRWGLMGHGTLGWHGDDGPTGFCGWSRMQLGWAKVVEITHVEEELRLSEVGHEGELYKIPVGADEFFLLEYRLRRSTYYDRHIPGEGVLIWHYIHGWKVDLECADGRWLDAGYPLGQQPDSRKGEDNLDFWAHDLEYAGRHAGNLGDATDPFDGKQSNAFIPETNPDSYSRDGQRSVRIEAIRLAQDVAYATVQTSPLLIPFIAVKKVSVLDSNLDGLLTFLEEAKIHVRLWNRGALVARNVRVRLSTEDPVIEILQARAGFGDLSAGYQSSRESNRKEFLRIRLVHEMEERREVSLALDVYLNDTRVRRHEFDITAAPSYDLSQNYPNPFNPATVITYQLPEQSHVTVIIYNLLGQRIRILVDEVKKAGKYAVLWDGTDEFGQNAASGVYLYRVETDKGWHATKKMTILR